MATMTLYYDPPQNPEDFESLCQRLFSRHWNVPDLKKFARRGTKQCGIDLIGCDNQGGLCGIQAKRREPGNSLTKSELQADIESAKGLDPKIERFAFATTAKRDSRLQVFCVQKTAEHVKEGLFAVELFSWDDINELLNQYSDIAEGIYGSLHNQAFLKPAEEARVAPVSQRVVLGDITGDNITVNIAQTAQPPDKVDGEPNDLHSEIDEAASHLMKGEGQVALTLLERIERRYGTKLTPRCHYRIDANKGEAYRQKGDFTAAGRLLLSAKQYQPEDQNARYLEALGYSFLGERDKAHALADGLIGEYSEYAGAKAVWLSTAPDSASFEELESGVPTHQRNDSQVAFFLAQAAGDRGLLETAEKYARLSLENDPDWAYGLLQLGQILVGRGKANVSNIFSALSGERAQLLQEAVTALKRGISFLEAKAATKETAPHRANLAIAYEALGEIGDAASEFQTAYAQAPSDLDILAMYGGFLARQDKVQESIDLLRKAIAQPQHPLSADLMLANLLWKGDGGDQDKEVISSLEGHWTELAREPEDFRAAWVGYLLHVYLALKDWGAIGRVLGAAEAAWVGAEERLVFDAEMALEKGDLPCAKESAKKAESGLATSSDVMILRRLAFVFQRIGDYGSALEIWQRIVSPAVKNPDNRHLMSCAWKTENLGVITEFCAAMRSAGIFDPDFMRSELAAWEQVSPTRMARLIAEFLNAPLEETFKKELRVVLALKVLHEGVRGQVETNPVMFPRVEEVQNVRLGAQVVEVLRRGQNPLDGVKYAYELFRRFPSDVMAHQAVMVSFNLDIGEVKWPDEPAVAGPGVAVEYKEEFSAESHWVIVEDCPKPDITLGEHPPNDKLALAMTGKAKGGQFDMPGYGKKATIESIVSKYIYRWRKVLFEMEANFPADTVAFKLNLPTKPDGTPDLEVFVEQLKRIAPDAQETIEFYKNNTASFHWMTRRMTGTVFDVMQALAWEADCPLRCCVGNDADIQSAMEGLKTANGIVLDSAALATASMLEDAGILRVQELFRSIPVELLVSEYTVRELRSTLTERMGGSAGAISAGIRDGRLCMHQFTGEQLKVARERHERLLKEVEEHCKVERSSGGTSLKNNAFLLDFFGRAGLESMMLAQASGRVLWTDDLTVGEMAKMKLGVRRAWTQVLLIWLEERGLIDAEIQEKATVFLVRAGYVFTLVHAKHIVRAGQEAGWDADASPLKEMLAVFADACRDRRHLLNLAAAAIKAVSQEGLVGMKAQAVTIRILENLRTIKGGVEVIGLLRRFADQIFGLDVVNAAVVRDTIDNWLGVSGRIIRP